MERKFSIDMAILVNSASRKIIIDTRVLRRLSRPPLSPSDRSFYDDIMIGSDHRPFYACTSPSLVRTPFDGDLSDPPPSYHRTTLWLMSTWLDTRKVRGVLPQGLTQSRRIPGMERKSFYDEYHSLHLHRLRWKSPVRKIITLSHLRIVHALSHAKHYTYIRQIK